MIPQDIKKDQRALRKDIHVVINNKMRLQCKLDHDDFQQLKDEVHLISCKLDRNEAMMTESIEKVDKINKKCRKLSILEEIYRTQKQEIEEKQQEIRMFLARQEQVNTSLDELRERTHAIQNRLFAFNEQLDTLDKNNEMKFGNIERIIHESNGTGQNRNRMGSKTLLLKGHSEQNMATRNQRKVLPPRNQSNANGKHLMSRRKITTDRPINEDLLVKVTVDEQDKTSSGTSAEEHETPPLDVGSAGHGQEYLMRDSTANAQRVLPSDIDETFETFLDTEFSNDIGNPYNTYSFTKKIAL